MNEKRPIPEWRMDSLKTEIVRIQTAQKRMLYANNALIGDYDAALEKLGLPADQIAELKQRYLLNGVGYPAQQAQYAPRSSQSYQR